MGRQARIKSERRRGIRARNTETRIATAVMASTAYRALVERAVSDPHIQAAIRTLARRP